MKMKRKVISFFSFFQVMEHQWNEIDIDTTNLTWTDRGSNPGLRGERPATHRLNFTFTSACTAMIQTTR
jgi:hypothetical protein